MFRRCLRDLWWYFSLLSKMILLQFGPDLLVIKGRLFQNEWFLDGIGPLSRGALKYVNFIAYVLLRSWQIHRHTLFIGDFLSDFIFCTFARSPILTCISSATYHDNGYYAWVIHSCKGKVVHKWLYISLAHYRKTSSISRTKYQSLNVSCILLQLSSLNPLNSGVKLRMKI